MKRLATITGLHDVGEGRVLCYDSNHNGLPEIIFHTGTINNSNDPQRWEVWECRPMNRFQLAFADTGTLWPPNPPPGIHLGDFFPFDIGEPDRDGRTVMVGSNEAWMGGDSGTHELLTTMKSPTTSDYPDSLGWSDSLGLSSEVTHSFSWLPARLNNDSTAEIFAVVPTVELGNTIWKNIGINQYQLVWHSQTPRGFGCYAFGDLDQDGKTEFATAGGYVSVMKCTGNDQYELVYQDSINLANAFDVFSGRAFDGAPEFFAGFHDVQAQTFYLYRWKSAGVNQYQRTFVDQKVWWVMDGGRVSKCGDIDGDGIDEVVWATPLYVYVYKETSPGQFQEVWEWWNDHGGDGDCNIVNLYDLNNDGYKEVVVGGSGKTSIFEIEGIRVLNPNINVSLHPGDTCRIRWQTFTPPRCDSISIFLRTDTAYRLDTLAHGLLPTATNWLWTVPDILSDYCHIVAIAYGLGWQYDESDTFFRIIPAGVAEGPCRPRTTQLVGVSPNPLTARTQVQFQLSSEQAVRLRVCDASGRTVATLADGVLKPGVYRRDWEVAPTTPNGIYFLSFTAGDLHESRKLILTR